MTVEDATVDTERLIAGFSEIGYGPTWFEEIFTGAAIVRPLKDEIVGAAREPILMALATVALLVIVAFSSVGNLLLVRAEGRRDERALRGALGAGRVHRVRYALVESGLLTIPGAVPGIALAAAGTHVLVAIGPAAIPRLQEIRIDTNVLLFTTSVTAGGTLLFGLIPAVLGGGGRDAVLPIGRGAAVRRPRSRTRGVLTFRLSPSAAKYPNPDASARFYDQLLEQVRALPRVAAAGAVTHLPLSGGGGLRGAMIGDVPGAAFFVRRATPGYFRAMGIPIIEGRVFIPEDHSERLGSVVVSKSLQREFWPHESALGKRIETWGARATVVGVVGDVHQVDLPSPAEQVIYKPLLDSVGGGGLSLAVVVRGVDDPTDRIEGLREVVTELDADLPLADLRTMESIVGDAMSRRAFTMTLITLAAGVALFLAAIGIYGVLSYVVSQRRREMAVRMAVGAERGEILALVLYHGMRLTALGLLAGMVGAVLLGRVSRSVLAEAGALDPLTLGSVMAIISLASIAASLPPALSSGSTSPADALREDA